METIAHHNLKRLAMAFLHANGCMAFAGEVRCPISRYRVDCAGYQDRVPGQWKRCEARTIVIECKQSREDFLRDRQSVERLLKLREHADRVRCAIEQQRIRHEEPHLRRKGTSLFAELDDWDFSASRLPCYRRIQRRLRRIDEQLYGETKFYLLARYQLADRLYLAAPRGLIQPCEVPRNWGLLECPRRVLEQVQQDCRLDELPTLHERMDASQLEPRPEYRVRLLRNIAVAATMATHQRGASVSSFSVAAAAV